MNSCHLTVMVYKEEDLYIAECPEVGTVDQGETIEQAIASLKLKQATHLYLQEFPHSPTRSPYPSQKKICSIIEHIF